MSEIQSTTALPTASAISSRDVYGMHKFKIALGRYSIRESLAHQGKEEPVIVASEPLRPFYRFLYVWRKKCGVAQDVQSNTIFVE